jgi:hypothetical protein
MLPTITAILWVAASLLVAVNVMVRQFARRHGIGLGWSAWTRDRQVHKLRVLATARGATFARKVRLLLVADLVAAILALPVMILLSLCMALR